MFHRKALIPMVLRAKIFFMFQEKTKIDSTKFMLFVNCHGNCWKLYLHSRIVELGQVEKFVKF